MNNIWYCKQCGYCAGKPLKGINPRKLFHVCEKGKYKEPISGFTLRKPRKEPEKEALK